MKTDALTKTIDPAEPLFDEAISRIEHRYQANPSGMGWRFAYGPRSALRAANSMWLIGLNPGGSKPGKAEPSREDGNGYRLEYWGENRKPNSLQRNIHRLFQMLSERIGEPWETLLDSCFTANACPFRSPSANDLEMIVPDWRAFCNELWRPFVDSYEPRVIVCLGNAARSVMVDVYQTCGFSRCSHYRKPTGWGDVSWSSETYSNNEKTVTIVRLPHLSRFQIFTSHKCIEQAHEIATMIAFCVTPEGNENN